MAQIKPSLAKVADLSTRFEALPEQTEIGSILWADIEITYILAGLNPTVDIRVPIPFVEGQTDAERKRQALRNARSLIDHACQIGGVQADTPVTAKVQTALEEMLPASLQGIAQELRLTEAVSEPRLRARHSGPPSNNKDL
jgi:hypothetical protein